MTLNKLFKNPIFLQEEKWMAVEDFKREFKVYEENNFNTEVTPDASGRKLKGLDDVGFINYVYWANEDINFGNTNDINAILKEEYTYPIEKKNL